MSFPIFSPTLQFIYPNTHFLRPINTLRFLTRRFTTQNFGRFEVGERSLEETASLDDGAAGRCNSVER